MDLVAYTRVSKVGGRKGESFQSPREQRAAIDAIATLKNARIVAEFEDLDESGGTMDRPGVKAAIEMVETGRADGVVVAYLDRWARAVEALELIERWAREGKVFISAAEQFDTTTPMGKFATGMMLLVGKMYRDRAIEQWDAHCRNAIERGVHVTVPYGYRRADAIGHKPHSKGGMRGAQLIPEEAHATVVSRIFRERGDGDGPTAIAAGLNADGIPSPRGGRWTPQAIRALVKVRAYKGEAHRGDYVLPDAHQALVSADEWADAQRDVRSYSRAPIAIRAESLLVGLIRCEGCGYVMGPSMTHTARWSGRRYHCGRNHSELRCPAPTSVSAELVERFVSDRFLDRYGAMQMACANAADPVVAQTRTTLDRARGEFATWRDDVEMRSIVGDGEYRQGLRARKEALDAAERAHGDAVRQSKANSLSVDESLWRTLRVHERRKLLVAALDAIVLSRAGAPNAPLADRIKLLWAGELDHDGTRRGIAWAIRRGPDGPRELLAEDAG